jgi:hypothetical protein
MGARNLRRLTRAREATLVAVSIVAATFALLTAASVSAKKDHSVPHVPPGQVKKDAALPGVPSLPHVPPGQAKKIQVPVATPRPAPVAVPATPAATPQAVTPQLEPVAPDTPDRPATRAPRSGGAEPRAATDRPLRPSAQRPTNPVVAIEERSTDAESPASRRPARQAPRVDRTATDQDGAASTVTRTVRDIVETVPGWMKVALAGLLATSLLLGGGYLLTAIRARSLARQRGELLNEVGLLQRALLPPVPRTVGALKTSAAYRPADGPGAGGDFYDALTLPGGRAAFVLGDVSGHGRDALERTAFMRYTLRADLEAGLEPRMALQVAERAIGERLGDDFATVQLAVHHPRHATLPWPSAGHPPPIVVGDTAFTPVTTASSPPIGVDARTGLRQTTLPLPPGSVACFYTDGLTEARMEDGTLLGERRLEQIVAELGSDGTASELIARVADETDHLADDMAAFLLTPTAGVTVGDFRREQLELSADDLSGPLLDRFLADCAVLHEPAEIARQDAHELAKSHGGILVSVSFGPRRTVTVLPRNVESIEARSLTAVG